MEKLQELENELRSHDHRLAILEKSQQELNGTVKMLKEDSAEIVKMGKEFIPLARKMMYLLAVVGATYILGGDIELMEKVIALVQKLNGIPI